MIPGNNTLGAEIVLKEQPNKTYKIVGNRISGTADNLEAVRQAIYLILNTERFRHAIYSWNYGSELEDLIGKQRQYAYPEIKRKITEALMQDDRIQSVDAFSFSKVQDGVSVTFTVSSTMGSIDSELVVNL